MAPAVVLSYRRLADRVSGLAPLTQTVRPCAFAEHVAGLAEAGVRFVSVADLHAASGPAVALSVDGAFSCAVEGALPVLERQGVPVTVFVSGAEVDAAHLGDDDWEDRDRAPASVIRPLSATGVVSLVTHPLVTVGAYVPAVRDAKGRLGDPAVALAASVDGLRRYTPVDRLVVAFAPGWNPYGRTLSEAARAVDAEAAVTRNAGLAGPEAGPQSLSRLSVFDWDTPATLLAKLSGRHGCAARARAVG